VRPKSDIEEQLRQAILDAPFSRNQLAKMTGMSAGVISHFMNHNRDLMLTTAAKIAAALGLELKPTKAAGKGKVRR